MSVRMDCSANRRELATGGRKCDAGVHRAALALVSLLALLFVWLLAHAPAQAMAADTPPPQPGPSTGQIAAGLPRLADLALAGPVGGPVCATASWVNPTANSPEGVSISVNLQKSGQRKILDTPLARLDFGGGNVAYAFCTDIYHPRPYNRSYCLDSTFFSAWQVAWLVTHYPPHEGDAVQQAARQAAVWYFADGWALDQADPTLYNSAWDAAVRNAHNAILAAIPAAPPPEYLPGNVQIAIEPATGVSFLPGQDAFPFSVSLTKGGYPLAGYVVSVGSTFGVLTSTAGITDASGKAYFTLRSDTAGSATITATTTLALPAGSRLSDEQAADSWQRLVLGQNVEVTVTAQASHRWVLADNLIIAHKFEDANFDGVQQEGEPDLAGWRFTLTVLAGGATAQLTATTDATGHAYFYNAIAGAGVYTLTETLQEGWTNRTPLSQSRPRADADPWLQWQAHFGNARHAIIEVIKFLDVDGDAIWDEDSEPPLPGWQFALLRWTGEDWAQHRGGATGSDGRLAFTQLAAGLYRVIERLDDHPGYINTTPLQQDVALGYPAHAIVRFGNRPATVIGDFVWNDANGNGLQDGGEPGINDVRMWLFTDPNCDGNPVEGSLQATQTTAQNPSTGAAGWYNFIVPAAGCYVVIVDETSAALTGFFFVPGSASGPLPKPVAVVVGDHYTAADFGYAGRGAITGAVFYDWNRSKSQDGAQETGLAGVKVCLYRDADGDGRLGPGDAELDCVRTDATGRYAFTDLPPGRYLVVETQPSGHQSTTPDVRSVALAFVGPAGAATGNDFGELLHVQLGDFIYVDDNQNGQQDAGETTGIGGVPVRITGVAIGGAAVDFTVLSASDGRYLADSLLPGVYTVTVPLGFYGYQRTSGAKTAVLTLTARQDLTLDFGYARPTATGLRGLAIETEPGRIVLTWEGEAGGAFHVWRGENAKGSGALRLTLAPVVADAAGRSRFADEAIKPGYDYWYWLEESVHGGLLGPWAASALPAARPRAFLPLVGWQ